MSSLLNIGVIYNSHLAEFVTYQIHTHVEGKIGDEKSHHKSHSIDTIPLMSREPNL